jgi:hypothetical protein
MRPRWLRRLLVGAELPAGFTGRLEPDERVVATAPVPGEGDLVVSSRGLWLPEGRRLGWHLVSKATWGSGVLTLVEAEEADTVGEAVVLRDLPARRLRLGRPGGVPEQVHRRVTGSIRSRHHRDLPGGGAWFVQRAVPGRDGLVLQVRPDPGTPPEAVRRVAGEVAARLQGDRR